MCNLLVFLFLSVVIASNANFFSLLLFSLSVYDEWLRKLSQHERLSAYFVVAFLVL